MNTVETKSCQNCRSDFSLSDDEQVFYDHIRVPAPTWCAQCRLVRRMASISFRFLFKNECKKCGKSLLSMYEQNAERVVYCNTCWWGDSWDAVDYGRDYDFSRPFFEQFKDLLCVIPRMAMSVDTPSMVNSDFCNGAAGLKDCYLVFHADKGERSYYSSYTKNIKDCSDVMWATNCELCYNSSSITDCFQCVYSINCEHSNNLIACRDCAGCSDCIGCAGLKNKQYYIFNKPHTKDQYEEEKRKMNLHTRTGVEEMRRKASEVWSSAPYRYMYGKKYENCDGDYLMNCKNVHNGFRVEDTEDTTNAAVLYWNVKDSRDYTSWGNVASLIYECAGVGEDAYDIQMSTDSWGKISHLRYCAICLSSQNLFGCAGMRKKQYCILNKKYTKEAYEELVPKIVEHMNNMPFVDEQGRTYRYGEYFPLSVLGRAYNESVAYDFFPKTKDQALQLGSPWKDREERVTAPTLTTISDDIKNVRDDISKEMLQCVNAEANTPDCTKVFKIIKQELDLYRKLSVPLPQKCPVCRTKDLLALLPPLQLWDRQCMCGGKRSTNGFYANEMEHYHGTEACSAEFKTTYSPDGPEIVYCENCYRSEFI
ncbi:hypothetical protein HY620_01515 [Candidatus Uhrbacteria bacterium]|nr:hypothetical protein [Candidatus Uhrbacteria bacterium]